VTVTLSGSFLQVLVDTERYSPSQQTQIGLCLARTNTMSTPEPPDATAGEMVTEPRETDVLCGRGGAALRHPGNQTYRRLVNLNKGLYITCLKTEKLKISRSIVAAIREQRGRFLEKEGEGGAWYDIGDKKAIEKTSQALREGQPKLRQKIVDMGGGVAGTAAFMESQYGQAGLYSPEQAGLSSNGLGPTNNMLDSVQSLHSVGSHRSHDRAMEPTMHRPLELNPDMLLQNLSLHDMSPGSSLHSMDASSHHHQQLQSYRQQQQQAALLQQRVQRLRPSITNRHVSPQELGYLDSHLSLLSDYSAFNGAGPANAGASLSASFHNDSIGGLSMDSSFRRNLAGLTLPQNSGHFSTTQSLLGLDAFSTHGNMDFSSHHSNHSSMQPNPLPINTTMQLPRDKVEVVNQRDRRRDFAKMKFSRPPSSRSQHQRTAMPNPSGFISQLSFGDGMADFNMVESSLSLHSAMSNSMPMAGVEASTAQNISNNHSNTNDGTGGDAYNSFYRPTVELAKVIDHSRSYSEMLGQGSRHSVMSGLSRISDTSIEYSIFSDLSRKIGNVSTRSLAMSEISAFDLQERDIDERSTASDGVDLGTALSTDESKTDTSVLDFLL
jgi:hypothetical protein